MASVTPSSAEEEQQRSACIGGKREIFVVASVAPSTLLFPLSSSRLEVFWPPDGDVFLSWKDIVAARRRRFSYIWQKKGDVNEDEDCRATKTKTFSKMPRRPRHNTARYFWQEKGHAEKMVEFTVVLSILLIFFSSDFLPRPKGLPGAGRSMGNPPE